MEKDIKSLVRKKLNLPENKSQIEKRITITYVDNKLLVEAESYNKKKFETVSSEKKIFNNVGELSDYVADFFGIVAAGGMEDEMTTEEEMPIEEEMPTEEEMPEEEIPVEEEANLKSKRSK